MYLENLLNNIKNEGLDIDDFNRLLEETDGFLTGSILSKSILDIKEDFPDNYIIIYIKGNKINVSYDNYFLDKNGYEKILKCDFKKNTYTSSNICINIIPLPELYIEDSVNYIYEYRKNNHNSIYIVYLKKDVDILNLIEVFDLSTSQIYYYDNKINDLKNIKELESYKNKITPFLYDKYFITDIIKLLKRVIMFSKIGIYTDWDIESKSTIGIKFLINYSHEKEWYFREWNNIIEDAYNEGLNIDPNLYLQWDGTLSNIRGTVILNDDKKFKEKLNLIIKNEFENNYDKDILQKYDIDEKQLPNTCIDSSFMEPDNFINFVDYISKLGDIIIVSPGKTIESSTIYCYTDEDIHKMLIEKLDGYFYKCIDETNIDYNTVYVKVYANSGFLVLVNLINLRKMIKSTDLYRLFYLVPKLDENNLPIKIDYTMSYRNAMTSYEDYTSSKHCQEGSSFYLYEYRVCNGNSCNITKSLNKRSFNYNNYILTHSYDLNSDEIKLIKNEYEERINEFTEMSNE